MKKIAMILTVLTGAFLLSNCTMPGKQAPTAKKRGGSSSCGSCCSNTCCCCLSNSCRKK